MSFLALLNFGYLVILLLTRYKGVTHRTIFSCHRHFKHQHLIAAWSLRLNGNAMNGRWYWYKVSRVYVFVLYCSLWQTIKQAKGEIYDWQKKACSLILHFCRQKGYPEDEDFILYWNVFPSQANHFQAPVTVLHLSVRYLDYCQFIFIRKLPNMTKVFWYVFDHLQSQNSLCNHLGFPLSISFSMFLERWPIVIFLSGAQNIQEMPVVSKMEPFALIWRLPVVRGSNIFRSDHFKCCFHFQMSTLKVQMELY